MTPRRYNESTVNVITSLLICYMYHAAFKEAPELTWQCEGRMDLPDPPCNKSKGRIQGLKSNLREATVFPPFPFTPHHILSCLPT